MKLHEKKLDGVGQFVSYFNPLLEALRALGGKSRPRQIYDAIATRHDIPASFLASRTSSGQPTFENRISWAKSYLAKAGYVESPARGVWALTEAGKSVALTDEQAIQIFRESREAFKGNEDNENAPENEVVPEGVNYWFVGASWATEDQFDRFLSQGIWQNGDDEKFSRRVRQMKVGDRIAIKSTFTKKRNVPFQNRGRAVSVMRIKAVGIITATHGDAKTVSVEWQSIDPAKEWYFYTYLQTISRARFEDDDLARKLVAFAFDDHLQDYDYFLGHSFWASRYGADIDPMTETEEEESEQQEHVAVDVYDVDDISDDGGFLDHGKLKAILETLGKKKNLILQGPPGTGKTWLAKRLAMALIGRRSPSHSQLRAMQFHPSLSYEDFVRGYRPGGDGKLVLTDGIFLQMIDAARAEPDIPHVLVIEEINRGNPAQIFGEMLTLLESTKRSRADAMELAYRKVTGEKIHVPDNLYLIGTMNVADRSLALVDLALRRRFAFVMLEPALNDAWENWCNDRGLSVEDTDQIRKRMNALNEIIATDRSLGPQFCIGHSYVTPPKDGQVDGMAWFREVIDTEISHLLDEYWFDAPDRVAVANALLRDGL